MVLLSDYNYNHHRTKMGQMTNKLKLYSRTESPEISHIILSSLCPVLNDFFVLRFLANGAKMEKQKNRICG